MEIVVVTGNGTSIVFSAALAGASLAKEVASALPAPLDTLLATTAKRVGADGARIRPDENFEHLLGPLDRMGSALGPLNEIADSLGNPKAASSIAETQRVIRDLYLRGVGVALEVVARHSRASYGPDLDRYAEFVRWVLDRPTADSAAVIRFFNLNYDCLLDSQVLALAPGARYLVADQADGREARTFTPAGKSWPVPAYRLREATDPEYVISNRMVLLYHLHGSLAWFRTPRGKVYKANSLDNMRHSDFYAAVADRSTNFEPVVVLTDRKVAETLREPFAAAYSRLSASLATATHVVIAGYGMGDVPLNRTIATALADRRDDLPSVAFLGYDSRGRDALKAQVLKKLAPNERVRTRLNKTLTVTARGLPNCLSLSTLAAWGQA